MKLSLSFTEYIQRLSEIVQRTSVSLGVRSVDVEAGFAEYIGHLVTTTEQGGRVFFIGNGGSAGICMHSANDYTKNGGIRSMALHDGAVLTCLGNDFGFESIFSKQLAFQAQSGDVLVAISSSGRSQDILNAVEQARAQGLWICTFSGFAPDNPLRGSGDLNWYIDSMEYGFVELGHQILLHCALDRRDLLLARYRPD